MMEEEKIDFVIPYVNNQKVKWREEYERECRRNHKVSAWNGSRFRDWDNFRYNIEGVLRYMPWISCIYIIIENEDQIPEDIKDDKIEYVFHKDIIPQRFLPTYNSNVIELFMHKIKGLSEFFIYSNDDIFALNSMSIDDFYDNEGKPRMKLSKKTFNLIDNMYKYILNNSLNAAHMAYDKEKAVDYVYFTEHNMTAMRKSTWEMLWDKIGDHLEKSCTEFRTSKNIGQDIFSFYHYITSDYAYAKRKNMYFSFKKRKISDLKKYVLSPDIQSICINDAFLKNFEGAKNELNNLLKIKFGS